MDFGLVVISCICCISDLHKYDLLWANHLLLWSAHCYLDVSSVFYLLYHKDHLW